MIKIVTEDEDYYLQTFNINTQEAEAQTKRQGLSMCVSTQSSLHGKL